MAIFKRTPKAAAETKTAKTTKEPKAKKVASKKASVVKTAAPIEISADAQSMAHVLIRPRITEKASESASRNCYVFDIHLDATKRDVVSAIRSAYKVTPVRVNVTYIRAKNVVTRRGQRGVKQGGKKAYVYLKKDDTITLM